MRNVLCLCLATSLLVGRLSAADQLPPLRLSLADYEDRVHAVWAGQVIGMLLAFPFEHRVGLVGRVEDFREPITWKPLDADVARVDDDWYYEIVALRAFEKYGPELSVQQLGQQWIADRAGTWGSSAETRRLLAAGVQPPDTGHPRYNPLWYTIGPQFSADIYGALAPGMPNVAGQLARRYGHINGYAEGVDGGVFVATMVSLAFRESDPRVVVRQAATMIHPSSPYRQCLDQMMALADNGARFEEVCRQIADRWHLEYPATNNAVANGGFIAAGLWYGKGDFMQTMNLISRAADFTDSDCNAANAGSVLGAMHGMRCLPKQLLNSLRDRIEGDRMGPVSFDPPVKERVSDLARRTVSVGTKILKLHGAAVQRERLVIPQEEPQTQPAELFRLSDLMQYWNPDWELRGAGFGYRLGVRGVTRLDGDVLATYPRDEVRGVCLRRTVRLSDQPVLRFDTCADAGRAWTLNVWVDNQRIEERRIQNDGSKRRWQSVEIDLSQFAGRQVCLRLYQLVLSRNIPNPGSAYWRRLRLQ
jgi:hypothetical protein